MKEFLHILLPNISAKPNELVEATLQTLNMMVLSGAISLFFGLIFGVTIQDRLKVHCMKWTMAL